MIFIVESFQFLFSNILVNNIKCITKLQSICYFIIHLFLLLEKVYFFSSPPYKTKHLKMLLLKLLNVWDNLYNHTWISWKFHRFFIWLKQSFTCFENLCKIFFINVYIAELMKKVFRIIFFCFSHYENITKGLNLYIYNYIYIYFSKCKTINKSNC